MQRQTIKKQCNNKSRSRDGMKYVNSFWCQSYAVTGLKVLSKESGIKMSKLCDMAICYFYDKVKDKMFKPMVIPKA